MPFTERQGSHVVPSGRRPARKRGRLKARKGGGGIDQLPSGRWRLRVQLPDRQVTYGVYDTEDEAVAAQDRWRLTHLLPADDPIIEVPHDAVVNVAVGGVRCSEWFDRCLVAKRARRSVVRVDGGRGGAASAEAKDRAQWRLWWAKVGEQLPQTVTQEDLTGVLREMEAAGRSPNTIRTHWITTVRSSTGSSVKLCWCRARPRG